MQAINTKQKIYDAATDLIDKKGFDSTTIEDISKKANVSVGAFYHYYKSKDDIYFELYKIADQYFEEEVYPQLDGLNAAEQLHTYFMHYAKYNNERGIDASDSCTTPRTRTSSLKEDT